MSDDKFEMAYYRIDAARIELDKILSVVVKKFGVREVFVDRISEHLDTIANGICEMWEEYCKVWGGGDEESDEDEIAVHVESIESRLNLAEKGLELHGAQLALLCKSVDTLSKVINESNGSICDRCLEYNRQSKA